MKKLTLFAAITLCVAAGISDAHADTVAMRSSKEISISNFSYEKGAWEVQALAGGYADLGVFAHQPRFDYALESLRIGCMVTDQMLSGWCRGNFEFLLEASGGEFFSGPASYLVAGGIVLRWNFVQHPNQKLVPYVQIGGATVYHDADTNSQFILGGNIEAFLQGTVGLRYHFNENWALAFEGGYRHISNASTTRHNLGLNSFGGQIGLSYFFR